MSVATPKKGTWNGQTHYLTITQWAVTVNKPRAYFDNRAGMGLQEILDELSSPAGIARAQFLYRRWV